MQPKIDSIVHISSFKLSIFLIFSIFLSILVFSQTTHSFVRKPSKIKVFTEISSEISFSLTVMKMKHRR